MTVLARPKTTRRRRPRNRPPLGSLLSPSTWPCWTQLCATLTTTTMMMMVMTSPVGVRSQGVPPTPQPPTVQPPTVQPPTVQPTPTPATLPPTPQPPTPMPPTPMPPSTMPPTPLPPSTMPPSTTRPPGPHPDDGAVFYLVEVRISCRGGTVSSLRAGDYLRVHVKEVRDVLYKATGRYSGLGLLQMYKVIGEPIVIAVLSGGTDGETKGAAYIDFLESRLCGLSFAVTVTPLTSFEAFARAIGAGTALTSTPSSRQLDASARIYCHTLQYNPDVLSMTTSAIQQLRQIVTLILQKRNSGQTLDAYKFLAATPVQFFVCANSLVSEFDRMFLDLWTVTNDPRVTSVLAVREVQTVDRYLVETGGATECKGFWCSYW